MHEAQPFGQLGPSVLLWLEYLALPVLRACHSYRCGVSVAEGNPPGLHQLHSYDGHLLQRDLLSSKPHLQKHVHEGGL